MTSRGPTAVCTYCCLWGPVGTAAPAGGARRIRWTSGCRCVRSRGICRDTGRTFCCSGRTGRRRGRTGRACTPMAINWSCVLLLLLLLLFYYTYTYTIHTSKRSLKRIISNYGTTLINIKFVKVCCEIVIDL